MKQLNYHFKLNQSIKVDSLYEKLEEKYKHCHIEAFSLIYLYLVLVHQEYISIAEEDSQQLVQFNEILSVVSDQSFEKKLVIDITDTLYEWVYLYSNAVNNQNFDYEQFLVSLSSYSFFEMNQSKFMNLFNKVQKEGYENKPIESLSRYLIANIKSMVITLSQVMDRLTCLKGDIDTIGDISMLIHFGLQRNIITIDKLEDNIKSIYSIVAQIVYSELFSDGYKEYISSVNSVTLLTYHMKLSTDIDQSQKREAILNCFETYLQTIKAYFNPSLTQSFPFPLKDGERMSSYFRYKTFDRILYSALRK